MRLDQTIKQRGKTHGNFTDNSAVSQALKKVVRSQKGYKRLTPVMCEALDMIFHKIGRIMAGNPRKKDHWHDIAGYATLAEERI